MTELEKIAYAKTFIDKMAEGTNPLDDSSIPDGDLLNQVRISRCLYFVSDILRRICETREIKLPSSPKKARLPLAVTWETIENYILSSTPLTISEFTRRVNLVADERNMQRISYAKILNWLIQKRFLEYRTDENGKRAKYPTKAGMEIGITTVKRIRHLKEFDQVIYNTEAQSFLVDHFISIEPTAENGENVTATGSEEQ